MPARFAATLNGFPLDLERIGTTFEKAIAVYEFPYRNGAKTEDMGETAPRHRFKAYWFGPTYEAFFAVREEMKRSDLFELVHPELGIVKGRISSMAPSWDDRDATAEVEFEFTEDTLDNVEPARVISVQAAVEAAFAAGQAEQMDAFAGEVRGALGKEAGGILAKDLDPTLPILPQFTGISLKARNYLKTVDAMVTTAEATLHDIEAPADSLIASIDYGLSLPGRVVGSLAKTIERYTVLLASTRTAPGRFLSSLRQNLRDLEGTFNDFLTQLKLAGAQRLSLEAATLFEADEGRRQELKRQEGTRAWDSAGHLTASPASLPIMNVNEVEAALALVRSSIQEAIDLSRETSSLAQMAYDLLEHVSRVKMEYESVITVDVPVPTSLFVLCLKHGLPYVTTERLRALNPAFPNPNFVQGGVLLYA